MIAVAATGKPASFGAGFSCAWFWCGWRRGAAAVGVLALASAGAAVAQVDRSSDYLQRMDTDADGGVSLAEYQHWMGYAFERMDGDGDGVLVAAELPGGRGRPVRLADHRETLAATFRRQDVNGDGVLDATELAAPPQ
ncbi:MAG: EF-hand domain-containing protein [Lysobacter sp.]